jgi:hypothetical protein
MTISQIYKCSRAYRIRLLAALFAACLCGPVACSDDADTGGGQQIQPGDDTGDAGQGDASTPDDNLDLDLAASLEVVIQPARALYNPDTVVQPSAIVYDGRGEAMGSQAVHWTVTPEAAASPANPGYRLDSVGPVTFQACTAENGVSGEPICGSKRIIVDNTAPTVTITSPAPGAWLGADGATSIAVEGAVADPTGELHAFVNGQEVELDDAGNFSTTLTPHFGVNHIEVVATDGVSVTSGQAMVDVLWAPAWYDMSNSDTQTAFGYDDGLVLDLGQRFFDDGLPPAQVDETNYITEDLADILTLLVKNIDFMSQITNPVIDSSSAQPSITSLSFDEPTVLLDLTDTGAELYLWVPNVEIGTAGAVSFDAQTLDLTGSISTDIAGFAALHIEKPGPGEAFIAGVDSLSLSLQNAESHFTAPEANAIFKLAESALRTKIETILADTLRGQFIDQLPTLLAGALNSIEEQLSGLSFDLDTEFTEPLTLSFDGAIAGFETTYRDSMSAVLSTTVSADQPPQLTHSPGIPLTGPYSTELPLFESSRAQIAVRLGLLNGLLHSLWETGFLEINLTELMPDQFASLVEEAHLSAKLQPVLAPPRAGEPYDFILSAGQMEIEARLLSQVDTYAINIEVGILMSLEDNAISLIVPDEPTVVAWVKSTTGDEAVLPQETVESLILTQVWPQIEETLKQGLSFELPVPSLSGLSDIAPSMSALEVDFLLDRPVMYRDGFIIFDAKLQGSLPLGAAQPSP